MKKVRSILFLLLIATFAFCGQAQAWDQHFTFTQVVVAGLSDQLSILDHVVKPVSLDKFLTSNRTAVKQLFKDFYTWKNEVYKYQHWLLTPENHAFLFADGDGRLDSKKFLELLGVNDTALTKISVSKEFSQQYNLTAINENTALAFATWLSLFSDEPDWGGDMGLFGKGDPRYSGTIPYGAEDGLSSQAPFHMYFPNESFITYKASETLKESMALLRFNVFVRLTKLAWQNKEYFWTARFLGNALHYLQDVATPYHSSALPYANIFTYIKYFAVKDKDKFLADNVQVLSNRHFAYEAFGLEFMLLTKGNLNSYIKTDNVINRGYELGTSKEQEKSSNFLSEIFNRVAKAAYKKAKAADKLVRKNFPKNLVNDPKFNPVNREDFELEKWFNQKVLDQYLAKKRISQKKIIESFLTDTVRVFECSSLLIGHILR